jgi:tRNA G37 N-methylase Trm5
VFDIFTETSIHLLYLLSLIYDEMYIYKPKTSRPTNSEKYVICKYFNISEEKRLNIINTLCNLHKIINNKFKYTSFKIFKTISSDFIDNIKKINKGLVKKQCDCLQTAVKLCNDPSFLTYYDSILDESIEQRKEIFNEWSQLYNLNAYV